MSTDQHRDDYRRVVRNCADDLAVERVAYEDARRRLRSAVACANRAGVPETELAKLAGVARATIRVWSGKQT